MKNVKSPKMSSLLQIEFERSNHLHTKPFNFALGPSVSHPVQNQVVHRDNWI